MKFASVLTAMLTVTLFAFTPVNSQAQTGEVSGQFVLLGPAPKLKPLIAQGAAVKDAKVCAVEAVPNQALVVNAKNKGIANVFIYLKTAPEGMPEELKTPKEKEVVLDQKGCQFLPHAFCFQTGQTLKVLSDDGCAHNTHSFPLRNTAFNFLMKPNERKGIAVPDANLNKAELLPIKIGCDFHPWMSTYAMILDHPYMAVSDAEGKFSIKGLPAGDYEFRIWHEAVGYINREYKVSIKAGETTNARVSVPFTKFDVPK